MLVKNGHEAFLILLQDTLEIGSTVTVRGKKTKELMMCQFNIAHPEHRVIIPKHRNGNIFAQIAETMWMLAGRDDLDWLEHYIPQCKKFSDDGKTWRAAYGPRLREWVGTNAWMLNRETYLPGYWKTDQVAAVINRLRSDPQTRQAVISLWDPAKDNIISSKDYPCNNWLHFIIRDNRLHLSVAVRSNDIMFGFSHADFFGWSVLQSLVAESVGVLPGIISWFATSMHVYEQHYDKAEKILEGANMLAGEGSGFTKPRMSMYDYGISSLPMLNAGSTMELFDHDAKSFFHIEHLSRTQLSEAWYMFDNSDFIDRKDFVSVSLYLLIIYNWFKQNNMTQQYNVVRLSQHLNAATPCDLKMAAAEYFHRHIPDFAQHFLERMLSTEERLFFVSEVLG